MKHIVFIFIVGFLMFSCGSKRKIAERQSQRHKTEDVVIKDRQESVSLDKQTKENDTGTSKVYANATEAYIDTYKAIAKNEMQLYGIPASITLAQGILESGSGKGRLSREANNHFGIKCHEWTGAKIYHDDDKSQECFRKYIDAKYSFRDHSLFLSERKRYAKLFQFKKEDYKAWAKGLRAAGYATDKKYPQKLISLIDRYQLYKFDQEVNEVDLIKSDDYATLEHIVMQGDTLYSISKKHNITVEELQDINGLVGTALNIGQVLQIKSPKKNY